MIDKHAVRAVIRSVTDLRREPRPLDRTLPRDMLQETQLLYGELVRVIEEKDGWALVEALEQAKISAGEWVGYPGWVKAADLAVPRWIGEANLAVKCPWASLYANANTSKKPFLQLSLGTHLSGEKASDDLWKLRLPDGQSAWVSDSEVQSCKSMPSSWRTDLLALAQPLIGSAYFWGGRSAPSSHLASGVDCSALVNLLYRTFGVSVPRDAFDQMQRARSISAKDLHPADLVFMTSSSTASRIDHVLLYQGGEELLEATLSAGRVRLISFKDRLGVSREELIAGARPEPRQVAFGRLV